ncbi:uncharacterized protein LOC144141457 isoform X2 [Haemaphysalis longicornis]
MEFFSKTKMQELYTLFSYFSLERQTGAVCSSLLLTPVDVFMNTKVGTRTCRWHKTTLV